jgi:hypothetical protein
LETSYALLVDKYGDGLLPLKCWCCHGSSKTLVEELRQSASFILFYIPLETKFFLEKNGERRKNRCLSTDGYFGFVLSSAAWRATTSKLQST